MQGALGAAGRGVWLRPGEPLDLEVQTPGQVLALIRNFRDTLPETYMSREHPPEMRIFATDDDHADKIVEIAREEFHKGNELVQNILYASLASNPRYR